MKNTKLGFGSFCAHELKDKQEVRPHQLPIYATSSFEFDNINQGMAIFKGEESGHSYSRYGNPTIDTVANKIAALEAYGLNLDLVGVMVGSGMAAISTLVLAELEAGDKILTQSDLYGGTTELFKFLQRLGIESIETNLQDLSAVEQLVRQDKAIRMIYFESPANPSMSCVDIAGLCKITKKFGRLAAIDNTFLTPYLQQPFAHGVDYVIHSTTKFLNGHGNSIAGIIIGKNLGAMRQKVWKAMKLLGTNTNAFDAWLINNGLKTLELRMDRHCKNAQTVAEYLEQHPQVARVNYNGLPSHPDHELAKKQMRAFGGMLSFELKGGMKAGIKLMNKVKLCTLAPTLGDVDTLLLHPASSSHINIEKEIRIQNGITDGLIRMSIGIENVEDIIADLEQAI